MQNWDLLPLLSFAPVLCFVIDQDEKLAAAAGALALPLKIDIPSALGKSPFALTQFPIKKKHYQRAQSHGFTISQAILGAAYETQLLPLPNAPGCVMGLTMDMTKHVQMEQYLDEERHRLLVSQRLNSLAGIAGGLAHEINNPLAIISGYAEQMNSLATLGKLSTEHLVHSTNKIMEACERCHRIIESIKAFARDGSKDATEEFTASDWLQSTLELCAQRMAAEGISLVWELPGSHLSLEGRRLQLVQALFNIVQNACDAAVKSKEPRVELKCFDLDAMISIQVIDSGPGITDYNKNRIFEPFFTTKDELKSVGVGLSTAKGIIEEHGGQIHFTSKPGATCFSLVLPKKT